MDDDSRGEPRRRARSRQLGCQRGVSNIIGTLLLALITVSMALAYSDFVIQAVPDPQTRGTLEVSARLESGGGQWGTGDEEIIIAHQGGQELNANQTTIHVQVGSSSSSYTGSSLASSFSDGSFTIGERWTVTETIQPKQTVVVDIVDHGPPASIIGSASLTAGAQDCSSDTTPPTIASWSRTPVDVDGDLGGVVSITATAQDACTGVDATQTPHLWYRLDDGTDPAFTDVGAMTHLGGASWNAEIPEPASGWDAHGNDTLEYYLSPLVDDLGNSGNSSTQAEFIEPADPNAGTLTYATDYVVFTGTLTDFPALQNASDGGNESTITEAASGANTTSSQIYGSAHTSNGATGPGNATGAPDDAWATLPSHSDWVTVSGFNSFTGTIEVVEIAFEGHATGTASGNEDTLALSYAVSGSAGSTSQSFTLSELGTTDGPAVYLNVTSDRAWSWADISNLQVKATYEKDQAEDNAELFVDALWVRVSYDDPAYDALVQVNVTGVPSGSDQTLELEYRTSDEVFDVEVYDHALATWTQRGVSLTGSTPTNWTYDLTSDELSGAGEVLVRFSDDGPDAVQASQLGLDYMRVRTR